MLVLTRKPDESLIICDDIIITILALHGNQIRLGIDAPKNISVHRMEVFQRIKRDHQQKIMQISAKDSLNQTNSVDTIISK